MRKCMKELIAVPGTEVLCDHNNSNNNNNKRLANLLLLLLGLYLIQFMYNSCFILLIIFSNHISCSLLFPRDKLEYFRNKDVYLSISETWKSLTLIGQDFSFSLDLSSQRLREVPIHSLNVDGGVIHICFFSRDHF